MPAVAERSIRIGISSDGFKAHLIATDVDPGLITQSRIVAALQEHSIPVSDEVMARIGQIQQQVAAGKPPTEAVLLAEGREPVQGTGSAFEIAEELLGSDRPAEGTEDRTDFYRSQILTVVADSVIGKITRAVPSAPGVDVFGKSIPAPPALRSISLGKNVQLAPDGVSVIATVAGKLHLTRSQVSVVPVVEIAEDVDFSTGNIDATTDVLVGGTIRDSFKVKSSASITVRGAIEAAEIEAGTDLQVNGGIASRGQTKVVVGGEVFTKFCNEARVEAAGDITIMREALNSQLRTNGKLHVQMGKVIGGRAFARCGGIIGQVGNEANVKTTIAVGIDPLAMIEAATHAEAIKKKLETISKIRENIQPLMAQLKRLTPAQRERATELLYQADSMEQEIKDHEQKRKAVLEQNKPDGQEVVLVIQRIAYPGVALLFGDRIAVLHKERKGPFKVVRRVHNRVEEILLIDKISGSVNVLNSREYDLKSAEADFSR